MRVASFPFLINFLGSYARCWGLFYLTLHWSMFFVTLHFKQTFVHPMVLDTTRRNPDGATR